MTPAHESDGHAIVVPERSRDAKGRVLLWGFYNQGNLGDDLMAVMAAELVLQLGLQPVILSGSQRFRTMGYETTSTPQGEGWSCIVLSGGAFIKGSRSSITAIEDQVRTLADYLQARPTPVIALSIGSDGVEDLSQISESRRRILTSPSLKAVRVRLQRDLKLGLPNCGFLPDIVLASRAFRGRLSGDGVPPKTHGAYFLNLSRRMVSQLPRALWLTRGSKRVFFLAHSGPGRVGGELAVPGFERFESTDIAGALDALSASRGILSSKLHPGIIALSMGSEFISIAHRPKTDSFVQEYAAAGIVSVGRVDRVAQSLRLELPIGWQEQLWSSYRQYLADEFGKVGLIGPQATRR